MSHAIPDAGNYVAFRKIQDVLLIEPGWVVIAVLETECPTQVYLNDGRQGFGQQKAIEYLVGLPGLREQADLFAENERLKAEMAFASSNFDKAMREWEETKKKMLENTGNQNRQLAGTKEMLDMRTKERDEKGKDVDRLKGEIVRLKESMATVMLLVADNQKASVADLAEAKSVGDIMGKQDGEVT